MYDLDDIIDAIYDTADDPNLWPLVLDALNQLRQDPTSLALSSEKSDHLKGSSDHTIEKNIFFEKNTLADERTQEMLTQLLPHFRRTLDISAKIHRLEQNLQSFQNVVDQLPVGLIAVDRERSVIGTNSAAERMVNHKGALQISNGKIKATTNETTSMLYQAIVDVLVEPSRSTPKVLQLPFPNTLKKISALVVRSTDQDHSESAICNILIAAPQEKYITTAQTIQELYQLSPAESKTVHLLVNGLSTEDICHELSVTKHTVRAHLKSAFAKTETRSQTELVSLVLQGPAVLKSEANDGAFKLNLVSSVDRDAVEQVIELEDKRTLAFCVYGDGNAIPVILFHGLYACRLQNPGSLQTLNELNIKLIVPDRPGSGLSFPNLKGDLTAYADDIRQLLAHLNLANAYFVGYSTGGLYACASAYYRPELCNAMALVSSVSPFNHVSELAKVRPRLNKLILSLGRYSPNIMEPVFRLICKGARLDPERFLRGIVHELEAPDKKIAEVQHIFRTFVDNFQEGVRHGVEGVVQDVLNISKTWPFPLEEIQQRTNVWHGAHDALVPLVLAQKFSKLPNSHIRILNNAGHMFIYERWQQILEDLVVQDQHKQMSEGVGSLVDY